MCCAVSVLQYLIRNIPQFFQTNLPEALTDGRVKFEGLQNSIRSSAFSTCVFSHTAHDFFTPQPIKNAKVFFMRFISHNWPDPSMREILKHLRAAAQPKTVLVIVDYILPYASPSNLHADISGAAMPPVPPPLLPNLGMVSAVPTGTDMHVCCSSTVLHCGGIDESRCR
jgi:hypothetical protein